MPNTASEFSGPFKLTRSKSSVNGVFPWSSMANVNPGESRLNHVRKVLSGSCKPPVSKEKAGDREDREVPQTPPIGHISVEENPAIVANQRREGIHVDNWPITSGNNGFRIDYGGQVHPGQQQKRDSLHYVADKNAQ